MRALLRGARSRIGWPAPEWRLGWGAVALAGAIGVWTGGDALALILQALFALALGCVQLRRRELTLALLVLLAGAAIALPFDQRRRLAAWEFGGDAGRQPGGVVVLAGEGGEASATRRWRAADTSSVTVSLEARRLSGDARLAWFTAPSVEVLAPPAVDSADPAAAVRIAYGADGWVRRHYSVPARAVPVFEGVLSGTPGACGNATLARPTLGARVTERVCFSAARVPLRIEGAAAAAATPALLTLGFPAGTEVVVHQAELQVAGADAPLQPSPAGLELRIRDPGVGRAREAFAAIGPSGAWRAYEVELPVPPDRAGTGGEMRLTVTADGGMRYALRAVALADAHGAALAALPLPARAAYGTSHPNVAGHALAVAGAGVHVLAADPRLALLGVGLALVAAIPTQSHLAIALLAALVAWHALALVGVRGRTRGWILVGLAVAAGGWLASVDPGLRSALLGLDRVPIWRSAVAALGWTASAQLPLAGGVLHAHSFPLELARGYGIAGGIAALLLLLAVVRLAGRRFGARGVVLGGVVALLNGVDVTLFSLFVLPVLALVLHAGGERPRGARPRGR